MSQVGPFRRRFKAHGQFLRPQCAIKVKWHFLQTTMVFGRLAPGVFVCNLWSNQELSHTVCPAAVVITRLCLLQVNQSVQQKKNSRTVDSPGPVYYLEKVKQWGKTG